MNLANKNDEKLIDLICNHDNDYSTFLLSEPKDLPSLTIVICYYNSAHIGSVLEYLHKAVMCTLEFNPSWSYEVLVINDGSVLPDNFSEYSQNLNLKVINHPKNKGRTEARNSGLLNSKMQKVLFMDADILIEREMIRNALLLHSSISRNIVSFGFFWDKENLDDLPCSHDVIKSNINDFRLNCLYKENWIGCDEDKKYIGMTFNLMKQTNNMRNWHHGYLGPWLSVNMILGGFFIVDKLDAISVSGFDKSFTGYGFTEQSLPSKLVAKYSTFLVPIMDSFAIHLNNESNSTQTKEEKYQRFKERHNYFFNVYLQNKISDVL